MWFRPTEQIMHAIMPPRLSHGVVIGSNPTWNSGRFYFTNLFYQKITIPQETILVSGIGL
jgi:hypothetical protein